MLVTAFLQDFESAYRACGIHERTTIWLFKQLLTGSAEVAVKSRITLPSSVNTGHQGALQTHFEVVQFLLKRYATGDLITN